MWVEPILAEVQPCPILTKYSLLPQFFDFHSSALQQTLNIGCSISSTLLQRDNNLLALVCDDFTIKLLDIETKRVIREFFGFRGRIVDIVSEQ